MQHIAPTRAYEVTRLLLPMGTLTNVAITTNAAVLLKVLAEGVVHPLRALRDSCEEMRKVAAQIAPTLFGEYPSPQPSPARGEGVISSPRLSLDGRGMPDSGRAGEGVSVLGSSPSTDERHSFFTFELFPDFPTLRDLLHLKKGVLTLTPYTTAYDVVLPKEVHDLGLVDEFSATLHKAGFAEERIASFHAHAAQHLIPMAFRQRVLLTLSKQDMIDIQAHMEEENESGFSHVAYSLSAASQ